MNNTYLGNQGREHDAHVLQELARLGDFVDSEWGWNVYYELYPNDRITMVTIIVENEFGKAGVRGFALCNPVDEFDPQIGLSIAISDALRKLGLYKRNAKKSNSG